MTPKKLSALSILIGLSILGQSSALYASQAQHDDADIDKIIQSLQKKKSIPTISYLAAPNLTLNLEISLKRDTKMPQPFITMAK